MTARTPLLATLVVGLVLAAAPPVPSAVARVATETFLLTSGTLYVDVPGCMGAYPAVGHVSLTTGTTLADVEGLDPFTLLPAASIRWDPAFKLAAYTCPGRPSTEWSVDVAAAHAVDVFDCAGGRVRITMSWAFHAFTVEGTGRCAAAVSLEDPDATLQALGAAAEEGPALACVGTVQVTLPPGVSQVLVGADASAAQCDAAHPPCGLYAAIPDATCAANGLACCVALAPLAPNATPLACLVTMKARVDVDADGTPETTVPVPFVVPAPCP
ncbi:MAG TPA: hypothetical protein VNX21_07240 [Candidatus Thermoplasmatota archaeon]|nr:hypothetical protein [Candidatus Thermoplasmatota archaeon]